LHLVFIVEFYTLFTFFFPLHLIISFFLKDAWCTRQAVGIDK